MSDDGESFGLRTRIADSEFTRLFGTGRGGWTIQWETRMAFVGFGNPRSAIRNRNSPRGFLAGFDHQHDQHGQQRHPGKDTKNYVERHMTITERTKRPVAESAATDADEIHDAIARRAQLRSHNLTEDRHVVAVEK